MILRMRVIFQVDEKHVSKYFFKQKKITQKSNNCYNNKYCFIYKKKDQCILSVYLFQLKILL